MAKIGSYGWSPEQLARINARREASGRTAYLDKRMQDQDYSRRYLDEANSYINKSKQIAPTSPEDDEKEMSLVERQAQRTKKFREQFSPKGSMLTEYEVKSKTPGLMKSGIKGGVGTSVMQNSYNQFTA